MPSLAAGRRVQPGDFPAVEGDPSRARREVAGDEAEQAGLASTVRPHDPYRVTGADGERQVLGDDHPAEPFGHSAQVKQRDCHLTYSSARVCR